MTWYLLPATLAMMIKLWLLFTSKSRVLASSRWIGFVAIFCVHNFCEILLFQSGLQKAMSADYLMRCYYICSVLVLIYSFIYVMSEKRVELQKIIAYIILVLGACLIVLTLFTDLIITGYGYLSYTITAVKGEKYYLFQLYSLCCLLIIFATLIFNFKNAIKIEEQVHYFYTFIAFTPLVIIACSIIVLMRAGFHINATMLLPVASTLFLIISLKGESCTSLPFNWRFSIPTSLESRLRNQLREAEYNYINKSSSHQEAMVQIEKALLEYQRDKHGGSIAKASKTIGIMRSTFYSKMNRFNKM